MPTTTKTPIRRGEHIIDIDPALLPPRKRYAPKSKRLLLNMKPLSECPRILRPFAYKDVGFDRYPPVLRQGFPIEEPTWRAFLSRERFPSIPVAGELTQGEAIILLENQLSSKIDWPVECHKVYGLPGSPYQVVVETANNYDPDDTLPAENEKKLREILGLNADEPKLWYLDYEWCNWDWRED